MKQPDWSKAPEGATHWEPENGLVNASWMKREGDAWYYWPPVGMNPKWTLTRLKPTEREAAMVPRPTPQWNGEGPPPVGAVCVLRVKREENEGGWMDAEIMYSSKTAVVWRWEGRKEEFGADWREVEFRPIHTPEQIAEEERIAAINWMEIDAGMCATAFDGDPEVRVWVENLIDKGWRKAGISE